MGHAGQGGSTTTEEEKKMLIEPAVLGPREELEKLFVRWSGRRSVMARIGRGAPGMLGPQMRHCHKIGGGKGVTRSGAHSGHFQGTMGPDEGGRAAGFVPTRTNLLLRPVNRLPGGGI